MNAPVILQFTGPPGPAGRALDSIEEFRGLGGDFTDTTMFQQAFAAGETIRIPAKAYTLHEGFIATKRHSALWDAGHTLILAADFPADQDVYTWKPALGELFTGWRTIGGPFILPAVDGIGRDGFRIDHTSHQFVSNSQCLVDGVKVGTPVTIDTQIAVGGYGINYIPHATDPNGLYTTTFSNLELLGNLGSLKMVRAGDSLNFWNIKTYGKGRGIDIETVTGAESSVFVGLNSTNSGGAFKLKNALLATIIGTNFEMSSPWTGDSDRAMAVFDNCGGVDFRGAINPWLFTSDGADCILAKNGSVVSVTPPTRLVAKSASGFYHFVAADTSIILVKDDTDSMIYENPYLNRVDHPALAVGGRLVSSRVVSDFGTVTSGTIRRSPKDGKQQKIINGGVFTLAPPTVIGELTLTITNNASAGAINTSGFSNVYGDAFDTVDGRAFECKISYDGTRSVLDVRKHIGRTIWSCTLVSNSTGASNTTSRNIHSGLIYGGTQVRVLCKGLDATAHLIVDNASIGIRSSGDTTTTTPVELLFHGASGFDLSPGEEIWSDWATLTFLSSDELMTTFDFAAAADHFSVANSDGNGRYATGGNAYNLANFPGSPALLANQCVCLSRIETA